MEKLISVPMKSSPSGNDSIGLEEKEPETIQWGAWVCFALTSSTTGKEVLHLDSYAKMGVRFGREV